MDKNPLIRKGLALGIILLFVGTAIIPSTAQNTNKPSLPTSSGKWLYVGGNGPGNYSTIQAALDDANYEDTIYVYSGIYYEKIELRNISSLTLIGENMWNTIIDGKGKGSTVIIYTSGNIFSNFTVQHAGPIWPSNSGIYIYGSNNVITHNRIVLNPGCGITCASSQTITENLIYDNEIGIVPTSVNNNISHNQIYHNNIGINLWECFCDNRHPNTIRWNNISNNSIGINFDVWRNTNNIISDNIIFKNNQGIMTSEIAGSGIITIGNKIFNNTIFNNKENGIFLKAGSNSLLNRIEDNKIFSNGGNGILFIYARLNTISGNNITSNDGSGIVVQNSILTSIYKNTISNNNDVGIYLIYSTQNTIKKNNFFNNSKNTYFYFRNLYYSKPSALQIRLILIKSGNKWSGNFWDEPQINPYKIEGYLGDWYYGPDGGYGGKVMGYYIDRYPAQEPYNIPG